MIDAVFTLVLDRLETALRRQFPRSDPHVVAATLGGPASEASANKLIVSLANIEREAASQNQPAFRRDDQGFARMQPPLNVNLLLIVAANYGDAYAEGLKILSTALGLFQSAPVLTPASGPHFPAGLERLTFEFVSTSLQDLNSLWAVRGALYLPSFVIKARMLSIARGDVIERVGPIETGHA